MAFIWTITGIGGLIWSGFCWFLWTAAGAGSAAALGLARLLQIDPLRVAWLADILDSVGGVAQVLVVLAWLIGMATLLLMGWAGARTARMAGAALNEARMAAGDPAAGRLPAVEGEVRSRIVTRTPGDGSKARPGPPA